MIEMFKYYARCNKAINAQMISVIEGAKSNAYDYMAGGFYNSIGDILNHQYIGDMTWLNAFRTIKEYKVLQDSVFENMPKLGERLFDNITDFNKARTKLDDIFLGLTEEIQMEDLDKTVFRINRLGQRQEKIFWKSLMHIFNHQTHHRGQISQILDVLKIDNDFSNMVLID